VSLQAADRHRRPTSRTAGRRPLCRRRRGPGGRAATRPVRQLAPVARLQELAIRDVRGARQERGVSDSTAVKYAGVWMSQDSLVLRVRLVIIRQFQLDVARTSSTTNMTQCSRVEKLKEFILKLKKVFKIFRK